MLSAPGCLWLYLTLLMLFAPAGNEPGGVMRDRFGDDPRAAPKPLIGILNIIEDKALLKCEVRGASPKIEVEWRDSDGNILPAEEPQVSFKGDCYYITLLTTVTRTNTNVFHCVATQEELSHMTEDKIYVPYCGNLFTSGQVVTGWFTGILTVALVLAVLVATKTVSIRFNKGCLKNTNCPSEKSSAPSSDTSLEELKAPRID